MLFDLITLSDSYTFETDTLECATIVTFLLGNGQYGATPVDGEHTEGVPIFLMGGAEEWYKSQFDRSIQDGYNLYINDKKLELITALRSVWIDDAASREECVEVLSLMPEENHADYLAKRHDRRRSSMNDIGKRAAQMADKLEGKETKVDPTPNQVIRG